MTDTETQDERSVDDSQSIVCSLSSKGAIERLAWIREELLDHLQSIEVDGESCLVFDRSAEAYDVVTQIVWWESQCCSWPAYRIELPPDEGVIKVRVGTDESVAGEYLDALGGLLEETATID